jgi:hypothetical protein
VVIDEGGVGSGVYDRLKEQGYKQVKPFNFGWKASNTSAWGNARAEVWSKLRDWLKTASIPKDQRLKDDLTGPMKKPNSAGVMFLEGKKEMKARGVASPDAGDAIAVTLFYPVARKVAGKEPLREKKRAWRGEGGGGDGAWMA